MDNRILGAFLSIVLLSMMIVPFREWIDTAHDAQVAQVASQEATRIEQAGDGYIKSYATQLEAVASATHSATVTVPMLISTGFLPQGYTTVNPYGQTWEVQVAQPAVGQLQAVVTTNGGAALKDHQAETIVADLGNSGGFYPDDDTGRYQSGELYGDGWGPIAVGPYSIAKGSVVDWVNLSGADDTWNFLYRNAVPGNTAVNTMNTPLIMAAVETAGNGCSNTGAIAQDGTGALLSCQSGAWEAVGGGQWKPPVATYSALPGTGNQKGDVRLTEDTDRAFAWNGASWQALAVDQNGNLTVPNQLSAENGQVQSWMGCDGHAGMSIGEINAISEPSCGSTAVGFDLGNTSTGVDTALFNQNGLQVWNYKYGTMFHVGYHGTANGPNYVLYGQQNGYGNWGFNENSNNGWGMVDTDGGGMNATPGDFHASINANDYYDRASGEWFSQVASQVQSQQNQINNLDNQYNNLNSDYSYQQTEIQQLQNQLQGQFIGSFGPATQTSTQYYSCGWVYYRYGRYWQCGYHYSTGPASASGQDSYGGSFTLDGSGGNWSCSAGACPGLPGKRLLVIVTGLVGSQNGGGQGANWDGLNTPCTGNGVGASLLIYVDGQVVNDLSLTKTGQPDYQTWVTTVNSATFMVPAGGNFSIQANSNCVQFKGTIWEF